jgi:predicted amidohydrolase
MKKKVRVAAIQCAIGTDVDQNLATCLRLLDKAAAGGAALAVLPEFCNHLSWYENAEHCAKVSVDLHGPFLAALGMKARQHRMHVVANCTVLRDDETITATSVLFSPDGNILGTADKQVLMGHENDFLVPAKTPSEVIATDLGRIGLYACMDGVICETPRSLALRGAQILCNSLNSFATDEGSLHIPVRAAENRVFVVAANKVGALIPEALLEPVSQATQIPVRFLNGAGDSQVVAPDGTVLAKAKVAEESVVFADIDPSLADQKKRASGTDIFRSRRPELYGPIAEPPQALAFAPSASTLAVACFSPKSEGMAAVTEVTQAIAEAARKNVAVLTLSELFCFEKGLVDVPSEAHGRSLSAVEALRTACARAEKETGQPIVVVTSLAVEDKGHLHHAGVVISRAGVVHRQPQVHRSLRHESWANLGHGFTTVDLPWGRLGVVVGEDALYPETFRLLALQGANAVAVPCTLGESWETSLGLVERAAENRLCLMASSRPFAQGRGLIATLEEDFTIMTPWKTRAFDGFISQPLVKPLRDEDGLAYGTIHPQAAENKTISKRTHLLDSRPWALAGSLVGR